MTSQVRYQGGGDSVPPPKNTQGRKAVSRASLRRPSVTCPFRQGIEASSMLENSLFPREGKQASSQALAEHMCHSRSDIHCELSLVTYLAWGDTLEPRW